MEQEKNVFGNPRLEQIFNLECLPVITLEIKVDDWNKLLFAFDDDPDKNFWIPGDFKFEGNPQIPNQKISNVALRVRGNSSRNRPEGLPGEPHNSANPMWRQASFALQFGRNVAGQRFEGLSRLNLKFMREDPTRIREVYSFDLYQQAKVHSAPLISMCRVYVQIVGGASKPAYFGLYKMMEFIDEDFLESRKSFFGDDKPGDKIPFLWKGDNGAALNTYDPGILEDRDIYDLRTNTSQRAIANEQLADFVRNLVTLKGDEFKEWAMETIHIPLLLKSYLINVICGNMDDYWVNSNNYNFYFNTHGRFFFIPNDFDTTLGTGWGIDAGRRSPLYWGSSSNPLIRRLLDYDDICSLYKYHFHVLTNYEDGPFYVTKSIARIEKWHDLIRDYVWDDTIHFGCQHDGSGCIIPPHGKGQQTPFEDRTAWWTSYGDNREYRVLERGSRVLNFFEVSGRYDRFEVMSANIQEIRETEYKE